MVQGIDLFFALFNNLAIFIALVAIYSFLLVEFKQSSWYIRQTILGFSFGIFAIGCMYAKIPVFEGVIVDQRNAIIALSGAFGGPLSAILSAVLAGTFRIYLGGDGVFAGVVGVSLAVIAGIGMNMFSERFNAIRKAVISALLATLIILPGFLFVGDIQTGWELMKAMTIPYGSAIFLGIFLGGLLLHREEERYQAKLLFRESEQKYRELVEGTNDLITHTDKHGNFTFVNDIAEKILGSPPTECIGMSAFQFIHPDDRDMTINWFNKCVAQKTKQARLENRQVNAKTGAVYTVLWSSAFHFNDSGDFVGVGSIARDITIRKQTEESLRKSEARYRTLFEHVPDGILIADLEGYYLDTNPKMCQMLGYTREELIGLHASDIVRSHEIQHIEPALSQITAKSEHFRGWQLQRKDGSAFFAEVLVTTMPDNTLLAMVRDITERKQAEEERLKLKKLESVGVLAGGIAHDFNNLLTSLFGNIEMAKMFLDSGHKSYKFLEAAMRSMESTTNLTKQLLTFAKGGNPVKETLSIGTMLIEMAQFSIRGSTVKLQSNIAPNLWPVEADKGQLSQVISNLVINAQQAMPTGGIIVITAKNIAVAEKPYVQITVQDEGVGIAPQYLDKIFDPYFSTKQQGSGLGLASSHSIISKHTGTITVDSQLNQGTTFTICLPAAKETLIEKASDETGGSPSVSSARILVMDDEEMVREVMGKMLEMLGHKVTFAVDGQEAIVKYRTAYEKDVVYDVVIADLTIPGGMGGQEAAREILKIDPQAKIIVSSGYATNSVMANYENYGFTARIVKPHSFADMQKAIQQVLKT